MQTGTGGGRAEADWQERTSVPQPPELCWDASFHMHACATALVLCACEQGWYWAVQGMITVLFVMIAKFVALSAGMLAPAVDWEVILLQTSYRQLLRHTEGHGTAGFTQLCIVQRISACACHMRHAARARGERVTRLA
jgi:hypothetical protein